MSTAWTEKGEEPTLETFFADPIVDLLMQRDGITQTDVRQAIENARSGFCPPRAVKSARVRPQHRDT